MRFSELELLRGQSGICALAGAIFSVVLVPVLDVADGVFDGFLHLEGGVLGLLLVGEVDFGLLDGVELDFGEFFGGVLHAVEPLLLV